MATAVLGYSVQFRRSRPKRVARWMAVVTLLAAVAYAGRGLPARAVLLGRQAACMRYARPPGPTRTYFAAEGVPAGIAGDRDYHLGYQPGRGHFWYFYPQCLAELEAGGRRFTAGPKHTAVFVGERVSPSGNRRLVLVRCTGFDRTFQGRAFQPATTLDDELHIDDHEVFCSPGLRQLPASPPPVPCESDSGLADPDDQSHLTIRFYEKGVSMSVEYWLRDDGSLTERFNP